MFPLRLGSELQNLVKKFQSAMKVQTKYRPNFEQVENFHEVECTGGTSIILIEKNELILNNRKNATTFNNYFSEIVPVNGWMCRECHKFS